jgi:uncharacterized protein (TIGR02217 family)
MFDDVRLPEEVERGATGGPRFQTSITVLATGAEQRNVDWSTQRARWELSYGVQTKEDFNDVIKFFYARQGRARGFRFKDWSDFEAVTQNLGTGTGVLTTFQLVKKYTSVVTYTRNITRPVSGTVSIFLDGVLQVSGVSVNYATGLVTFTAAPGVGVVVTATFEFDVPVRFDTDELQLRLETFDAAAIESLPVVELRE